jgi:hypothetical protein
VPVSTATAAAATSLVSTKLTRWSPLPAYSSPVSRMARANTASSSSKFCISQFGRRIVHGLPECSMASSTALRGAKSGAWSTPVADISTTCRTLGADAISFAMVGAASSSLSKPFSNNASASPSAAAHVVSSCQSNRTGVTDPARGPGCRLAARTGTPAAASAAVICRPALPVAPSTHTVMHPP